MSRITGTLGKGVAALTLDDDYKRRRREKMTRTPDSFGAGMARGGKGLVMVSGRNSISIMIHRFLRVLSVQLLHSLLILIK